MIGFITEKARTDFIEEDLLISKILSQRGFKVVPIYWDDFDESLFKKTRLNIFRTPWNYYIEPNKFKAWLLQIGKLNAPVLNPLPLVHWNLNKVYLSELQSRGIPIVPTLFFKFGEFSPQMQWPDTPTGRYVLKPAVSANAHRTFNGDRTDVTDIIMEQAGIFESDETLLLQPFLDTITSTGEFSFLFFNGEFSHALVKKPKLNDFRVQVEHGGTWDLITPTEGMIAQASQVVKSLGNPPLYARVDMVQNMIQNKDQLLLMELELFEPMLYIKKQEHAENFVKAILRRIELL